MSNTNVSNVSAECYFMKCHECDTMGCYCLCHNRKRTVYQREPIRRTNFIKRKQKLEQAQEALKK